MGKHDVEREKSNANMCVSLSHSMWYFTQQTYNETHGRARQARSHTHTDEQVWNFLSMVVIVLIRYDTIRYEAIHIRACSFISFVQCLVDLLTRLLPHSLTRSYAKPVRSITRTLVRSLVLHGHSVFLTLALSVSLSVSVVKLLKRVTHTLTNIPTMYRPFLYTCSHVSLELVL